MNRGDWNRDASRRWNLSAFGVLSLLLFVLAPRVHAATLDLPWFTFDGGGQTSSAGSLAVSGTIGQPDTGFSCGGSFTIEGGFWASQTISLPRLAIRLAGQNVTLTWPSTAKYSGFVLQETPSLSPPAVWTPVNAAVVAVNGVNTVTLPASMAARFYRLRKL